MHSEISYILVSLFLTAALLLTGHSAARGGDPDPERLASSYNGLGLSLYGLISEKRPSENIFISPLSISLALAMTYNGAGGETMEEIAGILRLEGCGREWINRSNDELMGLLGDEIRGVRLDIANSLWCRKGLRFDPSFLRRTSDHFGAEAQSLDFGSPEATSIINGWVSDRTEGMIDEVVSEISPLAVLFLINAVYFKGEWEEEFDPDETREDQFRTASGGLVPVQMMHHSGRFSYRRGEGYQAAALPYGDGRMSMYIVLPDSSSSLEEFRGRLSDAGGEDCLDPRLFSSRKGSIAIPRFRAEFDMGLRLLLEALGMVTAFDRAEADFSGMMRGGPAEIWIDDIFHKAVIEVTEKGTEAAAVTSVNIVAASISMDEPFSMVLDRPFFFTIRDDETGTILFMGSIADPEPPEREW